MWENGGRKGFPSKNKDRTWKSYQPCLFRFFICCLWQGFLYLQISHTYFGTIYINDTQPFLNGLKHKDKADTDVCLHLTRLWLAEKNWCLQKGFRNQILETFSQSIMLANKIPFISFLRYEFSIPILFLFVSSFFLSWLVLSTSFSKLSLWGETH